MRKGKNMEKLSELLATIKEKETAYSLAHENLSIENKKYTIAVVRLEQDCNEKIVKARQECANKINKAKEELETKKKKISVDSTIVENEFKAKHNFNAAYYDILGRLKISNETLCQLLQASTGKKWKFFSLGGGFLQGNNEYYGLVFANENSKLYRKWFGSVNLHNLKQDENMFIVVGEDSNAFYCIGKQERIEDANWAEYYLAKKFRLNIKNEIFSCTKMPQSFEKLVTQAIDQYVSKLDSEQQEEK